VTKTNAFCKQKGAGTPHCHKKHRLKHTFVLKYAYKTEMNLRPSSRSAYRLDEIVTTDETTQIASRSVFTVKDIAARYSRLTGQKVLSTALPNGF